MASNQNPNLKMIVAKVLLETLKNPEYKSRFSSGKKADKLAIMKMVVEELYKLGVYSKVKFSLLRGYRIVECTKEEAEKFLQN
jgi:hypothetical protein